jgi:branched-chain amino acid transport system permease protein
MLYFAQQVLNGLHAGALYALLAFGYALTNGVVRRTNLAYGAIFAFSGQTMILVAVYGWYVLWLALPLTVALGIVAAFAYAWLLGEILGRSVFSRLAERAPNAVVIATLGFAIAAMELARIAAETRDFWLPPMFALPVVFFERDGFRVTLTLVQIFNCAVIAIGLLLAARWLRRSDFGRRWRAVCDDTVAAAMCGVDVPRTFRGAIVLGSLAAAAAGVLAAFYFGNISFGTGLIFGLKILFITAVGGYDAPPRAALGAAAFGVAEALWSAYFPIEWRDVAVFAGLVILLVLRATDRDAAAARG